MALPAPQKPVTVTPAPPAPETDADAPSNVAAAIETCIVAFSQTQVALFSLLQTSSLEDSVTGASAAIEKLTGPARAYACHQALRLFGSPFSVSLDLFELLLNTLSDVRGLYKGTPHPLLEAEGEILLGNSGGLNLQVSNDHPQLAILTDLAKACCFAAVVCGPPEWDEVEYHGRMLMVCRQAADYRQAMYQHLGNIYEVDVEERLQQLMEEADDDSAE